MGIGEGNQEKTAIFGVELALFSVMSSSLFAKSRMVRDE